MSTTLLGIVMGLGMTIFAIIGVSQQDSSSIGSLVNMYLNMPSFLMVFGGTIASTLVAHPFSHLVRGFTAFFVVFTRKEFDWIKAINTVCEFSQVYIQKGIPGLEEKNKTHKTKSLVKDGISMYVNGYKLEEVKEFLETTIERRYDREMIDYYVFRTMGSAAPAFGMAGTLVGLIFMLRVMSESPDKMGPFLAIALITTFYGLILAHLVFNPIGNKLKQQAAINVRVGTMEIEGIVHILKKQHPVYIKDQLSSYIPPKERLQLFKEEKNPSIKK
ncbi:MAG: MotA/TolQ/ExbB proton channel family protein [Elusimicrobiota bacterium]